MRWFRRFFPWLCSLAAVPVFWHIPAHVAAHPSGVWNIAHRGASGGAPENTFAAFDLAVRMGADLLELDVHLSRDGEVVVIHDDTLERTTNGSGYVGEYSAAQLGRLEAGSWYHPRFAGEAIPTLRQVLERYQGKVGFLVELKVSRDRSEYDKGIAEKVARVLRDFRQTSDKPLIVQSFHADVLHRFRKLLPDVPIGILVASPARVRWSSLKRYAAFVDYINPEVTVASLRVVKDIHRLQRKVLVWTAQDKREVARLIRFGVDGIICDYPEWVAEEKRRMGDEKTKK